MLNDFKTCLETELVSGMLFHEDNYSLDAGQHFELAPNDIVKIDLRPLIQKTLQDLKAIKSATYGQVNVDEDTGEVSINGESLQSTDSNEPSTQNGAVNDDKNSEQVSPDQKNDIVEFLKMLKDNGALEQLGSLDQETKKKIADAVYKLINGGADENSISGGDTQELDQNIAASQQAANIHQDEASNIKQFALKNAKKAKTDQEFFDMYIKQKGGNVDTSNEKYVNTIKNAWHAMNDKKYITINESDINLLKEAFIILFEDAAVQDQQIQNKAAVPAAGKIGSPIKKNDTQPEKQKEPEKPAVAPTQAAAPAPKSTLTQEPAQDTKKDISTMKMVDIIKDPNYKNDPKVEYFNKINQQWNQLKQVRGAKDQELLAKVIKVNDDNSITVSQFKKTDTDAQGKSNFTTDGQPSFTIPQTSVLKRMPVEQIKKKGLFSKFFGH